MTNYSLLMGIKFMFWLPIVIAEWLLLVAVIISAVIVVAEKESGKDESKLQSEDKRY